MPPGYFDPKGPAPELTGIKGDTGEPGAYGLVGPPGPRVTPPLTYRIAEKFGDGLNWAFW